MLITSWPQDGCHTSWHSTQIPGRTKGKAWRENANNWRQLNLFPFQKPGNFTHCLLIYIYIFLFGQCWITWQSLSARKIGKWIFLNTHLANQSMLGILLVIERVGAGAGKFWYLPRSSKYLLDASTSLYLHWHFRPLLFLSWTLKQLLIWYFYIPSSPPSAPPHT